MFRKALLLTAAAYTLAACQPSGPDIPREWGHVQKGMLLTEVEGLVGRKADHRADLTGRSGLSWNSSTHTLKVIIVGGKVDDVSIDPKK